MVQFENCEMWRLIFSKFKLKSTQKQQLQQLLGNLSYTCSSKLRDLNLPEEFSNVEIRDHHCKDPIEKLYYSALMFPLLYSLALLFHVFLLLYSYSLLYNHILWLDELQILTFLESLILISFCCMFICVLLLLYSNILSCHSLFCCSLVLSRFVKSFKDLLSIPSTSTSSEEFLLPLD